MNIASYDLAWTVGLGAAVVVVVGVVWLIAARSRRINKQHSEQGKTSA